MEDASSTDAGGGPHEGRETPRRQRRRRSRRSSRIWAGTTSAASCRRSMRPRARIRRGPTVIFAYTIKGYGLEIAGRPQNHSALLTGDQIDEFRLEVDLDPASEWDRFDPQSAEGALCEQRPSRLTRQAANERPPDPGAGKPLDPRQREEQLDPGGARARPARPVAHGRRPRRAARHRQPGRERLDEPRRLDQQGRLGADRGARVRGGGAGALALGACRRRGGTSSWASRR